MIQNGILLIIYDYQIVFIFYVDFYLFLLKFYGHFVDDQITHELSLVQSCILSREHF
jgi:hypothetical protein